MEKMQSKDEEDDDKVENRIVADCKGPAVSLDEGIERCAKMLANMAELNGLRQDGVFFEPSLPGSNSHIANVISPPNSHSKYKDGQQPVQTFQRSDVSCNVSPPPLVSVTEDWADKSAMPSSFSVMDNLVLNGYLNSSIKNAVVVADAAADGIDSQESFQFQKSDSINSLVLNEQSSDKGEQSSQSIGCKIKQSTISSNVTNSMRMKNSNYLFTGIPMHTPSNWVLGQGYPSSFLSFPMSFLTGQGQQSFMPGASLLPPKVNGSAMYNADSVPVMGFRDQQYKTSFQGHMPSDKSKDAFVPNLSVQHCKLTNQQPEQSQLVAPLFILENKQASVCKESVPLTSSMGSNESNESPESQMHDARNTSHINVAANTYLPKYQQNVGISSTDKSGFYTGVKDDICSDDEEDCFRPDFNPAKMLLRCVSDLKGAVGNRAGDRRIEQLLHEIESAVGQLPEIQAHRDIQSEVELALQPLRSENCQLRRRIRIINQQLRERERAEKARNGFDISFEIELESMNASLQAELDEEKQQTQYLQSTLEDLEKHNRELEYLNQKLSMDNLQMDASCDIQNLVSELSNVKQKLSKMETTYKEVQQENDLLRKQLERKENILQSDEEDGPSNYACKCQTAIDDLTHNNVVTFENKFASREKWGNLMNSELSLSISDNEDERIIDGCAATNEDWTKLTKNGQGLCDTRLDCPKSIDENAIKSGQPFATSDSYKAETFENVKCLPESPVDVSFPIPEEPGQKVSGVPLSEGKKAYSLGNDNQATNRDGEQITIDIVLRNCKTKNGLLGSNSDVQSDLEDGGTVSHKQHYQELIKSQSTPNILYHMKSSEEDIAIVTPAILQRSCSLQNVVSENSEKHTGNSSVCPTEMTEERQVENWLLNMDSRITQLEKKFSQNARSSLSPIFKSSAVASK